MQHLNIKEFLNNSEFKKRISFLIKSSRWSKTKHLKYQLLEFKKLIKYISKNIPFYIDYFQKKKLSINDFKSFKDLKKLPIINKDVINKHKYKFISLKFDKKKLFNRTTGGSTGHLLTIWYDKNFLIKDKANTLYYLKIFNLDFLNFKNIRLYGDKILNKKNYFWKKINNNKILMSAYDINEKSVDIYVNKIIKFKPIYIHTRSSIIYLLAKFIKKKNLTINCKIKYIFVDGEYLMDGQRQLIEEIFKCRVINIYGHTEGVVVGHPCKHNNLMHFMPQNGWIEYMDKNNKSISKKSKSAKMIVTGFNNYVMPLIRYDTGDYFLTSKPKKKCKCFMGYDYVKEVEGRIQDFVFDKKKNSIPLAPAIFNYNDMDWKNFGEFRVVQKKLGELIFEIISKKNEELENFLKKKIKDILGNKFKIKISFVDHIPRSKIGKFRYLKQYLDFKNL